MKELYNTKLNTAYDGNVSFKPKCKNVLYISPGSRPKYNLKPKYINTINIKHISKNNKINNTNNSENISNISNKEIIRIKDNVFEYNYIETNLKFVRKFNNCKPSGEIKIHTNIINLLHEYFDKMDLAVVHCHPMNILAFIGLKNNEYFELNDIVNYFPELPSFIKIADNVNYIESKTEALADTVVKQLNHKNFIAIKNHGIICYSNSFDKCIDMINTVDYYCECALKYIAVSNT